MANKTKSVFEADRSEFERLLMEANEAKDRLARIADRLSELGYARKSRSAMNLVYDIEEWQRRGA